MQKVTLGTTHESVSQFCLGCMNMGSTIDRPTSYAMLDRFLDAGGNFLDTANCYAWWNGHGEFTGDESETLLGQWMKEHGNREQVFLASKAGARIKDLKRVQDGNGSFIWELVPKEYEYLAPATIRQAIEGSLRRLQTDRLDLYYAHVDDRVTPLEETLGALNRLVEEGKVRYIGCSNYRTWRLERACGISRSNRWAGYVAVQQQYSYLRPKLGADLGVTVNGDAELLDYLSSNPDVALIAYSPLLKGIYDDARKRAAYNNWYLFDSDDTRARLETLAQISRELNASNSQIVLAWLLHHQPRAIPIVAASRMEQFEHNLGALDIELSAEQMIRLDTASA
jgi:aryl-alcohol dehydrogenase-like predicted oxidoreductase